MGVRKRYNASNEVYNNNVINLVGRLNNNITKIETVGDKYYPHEQTTADTVWRIEHNLEKKPSVTLEGTTNSNGDPMPDMEGEVNYVSDNVLTITFSQPVAGWAYLN